MDCLVLELLPLSFLFLFFWHHADRACVIELFVVEIVGNRQEKIEHLPVSLAREDQNGDLLR